MSKSQKNRFLLKMMNFFLNCECIFNFNITSSIVHYKEYVDIDEELRPLDQESYNRLQLSASCRLTLGAGDSHEVNEVVYLSSASQGWFIILIVTKSSLVPYALQMKIIL